MAIINRYRRPNPVRAIYIDSRYTGDADTVASFDEDGNPSYTPIADLEGGGSGSGGPSTTIEVTDTIALDPVTHNAALIVVNNTAPITITLPEFTDLNSFLYIKKLSEDAYPITIEPFTGATVDGSALGVEFDQQYACLYIFYSSANTFYIL